MYRLFILFTFIFTLFHCKPAQKDFPYLRVDDIPLENEMQRVGIRGSESPLSWDRSIYLDSYDEGYFLNIPIDSISQGMEYKYVIEEEDGAIQWEFISNRLFLKEALSDTWNTDKLIPISAIKDIDCQSYQEDVDILADYFRLVHPGSYRYIDSLELEKEIVKTKNACSSTISIGDAYLQLARMTAAVQCDHSKVGFNNQSSIINSIIHGQKNKLPFTFRLLDGEMILLNDASKEKLPSGTIVHSINDISADKIISSLFEYVSADGATDGNRLRKLEVQGYDFRFNAFDVLYPLLYPVDGKFNLVATTPSGNKIKASLSSMTLEERKKIFFDRYPDFPRNRDDLWSFHIQENIAYLKLGSYGAFGWKSMKLNYQEYLDSIFQQLAEEEISSLIIDIRENTGGADPIKKVLFSYLSQSYQPNPINRVGKTRYTSFPERLKKYIKTWGDNPWFYNLEPDSKEDGYYLFKEPEQEGDEPPEFLYHGKLCLLTSGMNTSLAYYTAAEFKHKRMGKIIGTETGGNLRDINGGQIVFLTLPNSGIEVDLPVMGGFTTQKVENSGVVPDHEVLINRENVINGEDPVLEFALSYLKNTKNEY